MVRNWDDDEDTRAERYRRSRSPSFGEDRKKHPWSRDTTKSAGGSIRETMSRVVSKLQDKATSEGPKPPISEPPNLRARVEHVVQQTLARESSKATGGAKANNANSTSVAVPQSKDGSGSNLRRVLHKIVDDTKFTKSAPPASDRRSKGPKGSKGSVFRHW
ncbi:unnamed protein product [Cladocopium goreaui]|uniref:Uncharacterized protein n=1 Tax=Cladocopium goreaui TaxID=2562237 RepID=A0A9P1GTF3_9DINO|nr:unnamed protein product [Cladocopium goreaui]